MATSVTLPELGESVTEGTVTRWLKQVGDSVAVDEPLLEVSTDKVDTEIPSPVAGTLLEIKAEEDETVAVGAELAIVGDSEEQASSGDTAPAGDAEASADEQPTDEESDGEVPADEETPGQETPADDETGRAGEAPAQDEAPGEAPTQDEAPTRDEAPAQEPPAADAAPSSDGEGTAVKLPELGESVTEGTVTRWLKQVGDSVEVDEPILEVSTDKVDTEIPSPVAGTLLEIMAEEDETVAVGADLAIIGSADAGDSASGSIAGGSGNQETQPSEEPDTEATAEPGADDTAEPEADDTAEPEADDTAEPEAEDAAESEAEPQPPADETAEPDSAPTPEPAKPETQGSPESARSPESAPSSTSAPVAPSGDGGSYVTPIVRKLANQHDVDLSAVTGTGVGGRIRKQDVLDAAKSKQAGPAEQAAEPASAEESPVVSPLRGKTEKLSRLRKLIATRMVESLQVSAQLTTVVEIDVTDVSRLRTKHKDAFLDREGVKLSYLPFFAKAAVDALKQFPQVNSTLDVDEGTVTYHGAENLGMAVDTDRGLLVPVIKDAGDLSIAGLARKIADVADRTRTNKITPDDLSGGTFTLTNTGSRGALFDTPIINQPQVAILGTGAVVKRPVVIDDAKLGETIAVRQMVYFALTYDHRIVDGADAARFLSAIKERLEQANFESELG